MSAEITVAVVSWNTRVLLDACLASLRPDHDSGLAEVWVIDNASEDDSADMVAEHHPWVRLVRCESNLGYGPAVNVIARRTTTPFLIAANADLRFEPDALQELLTLRHATRKQASSRLDSSCRTGARSRRSTRFPRCSQGSRPRRASSSLPPVGRALLMEGRWDVTVEREVDWVHGAVVLVPRAVWDRSSGFDDDQWLYAEDLDLCWRVARAGYGTRLVPSAAVHHQVSAATVPRGTLANDSCAHSAARTPGCSPPRNASHARGRCGEPRGPACPGWALASGRGAHRPLAPLVGARDRLRTYVDMHRTGFEPQVVLRSHRRNGG